MKCIEPRCPKAEVEGLEHCLDHMPADLLAEAEAITGVKRITPRTVQATAMRVITGQAMVRAGEIIGQHHELLARPVPVQDPFTELMDCAGEVRAWKDLLRDRVLELKDGQWRYQGKTGEQVRAEIILYERALTEFTRLLRDIVRLNLDARLAGIRQQQMDMLDLALNRALEVSGIPLARRSEARSAFRDSIKIIDGERAG